MERRRRLHPNAENCSQAELELAIGCTPTLEGRVRLMAIRALMLGHTFETVREIFNTSRLTLYRWIWRFNAEGIDGVADRPRPGRPRKIGAEKVSELRDIIEHPEKANELFWTARKFHGYLVNDLREEVSYPTVVRFLHEQKYALKVPRSWPFAQDDQKREAFFEQLKSLLEDPNVELWYLDECGVEGDPRPRRRWVPKGSRPTIPYSGDHVRMNVCGMVCPRIGEFFACEFDFMDRFSFQAFLDVANKSIQHERASPIIILDNASWHKVKSLDWGRFKPVFLPPYSPDLNPIERLWLHIKTNFFADFFTRDLDILAQRLDLALNTVMAQKNINQSICRISQP